jgi:hypothetical protein
MSIALAALLSLLAGLIGAVFGHALSERKSRNDELAKMRLDAYSDFLRITIEATKMRANPRSSRRDTAAKA